MSYHQVANKAQETKEMFSAETSLGMTKNREGVVEWNETIKKEREDYPNNITKQFSGCTCFCVFM